MKRPTLPTLSREQQRNALAVGSLAAIAAGCWLAWAPLGLIVPGAVVLSLLILDQLRGPADA